MMAAARTLLRPDNGVLIAALCGIQLLLIAVPALWSINYSWVVSAGVVALAGLAFSTRRTLIALTVLTIVLPDPIYKSISLPMGLRLAEILLIAAFLFCLIDIVYRRGLAVTRSGADLLLLGFLMVAVLSVGVGLYHEHDTSTIFRNARFPLYYAVVFLVVQSIDRETVLRIFVPLLVLSAAAVAAGYILEFLGAIDLSAGERFFRVARRQGIILPVALLLIVNLALFAPRRYGRLTLVLLFLPIGLALALTVGRAMWVSFALGLVITMWLRYGEGSLGKARLWLGVMLTVITLAFLVGSVLLFQRFTGTAITAHAVERSRTFVDYTRDVQVVGRLLGYTRALEAIAEHPILGSGQGKNLTFYSFNPDTDAFETWRSWTLDSLYLTLWLKMGLPGIILFLWLYLHILKCARSTFAGSDDPSVRSFASAMIASLVAMLALGISDGSLVNGRFAIVFAVLFGLVLVTAGGVRHASTAE